MKITINGYVTAAKAEAYHRQDELHKGHKVHWRSYKGSGELVICEQSIEVDVPDDWNPIPEHVTMLEEKLVQLDAAYIAKRTEIRGQIQDLLALTNEMEAA